MSFSATTETVCITTAEPQSKLRLKVTRDLLVAQFGFLMQDILNTVDVFGCDVELILLLLT